MKRTPPTMKQIKKIFERCTLLYKESQLPVKHLDKDIVVTEFRKMVRTRKSVVKQEKVSRVKKETVTKPKPWLKGKKRKLHPK